MSANGFGKSNSHLRRLHNLNVGVQEHKGQTLKDVTVLTESNDIFVPQSTLEDARSTTAGKFLLRLLAAVDYAGKQARPIVLYGRKQAKGGLLLTVNIPIDTTMHPGPAPGMDGHGVIRKG